MMPPSDPSDSGQPAAPQPPAAANHREGAPRRPHLPHADHRRPGSSSSPAIALIGIFLLIQAIPALQADKANFLFNRRFLTNDPDNLSFGILDLLEVTVVTLAVALVIAMPVSLGIALFLTQYAPTRLARAVRVRRRPARRGAVDHLRPVGHPRARPGARAVRAVAQRHVLGWFPLFAHGQRRARAARHDLHRRHRARGDAPADHHLGHAARCSSGRRPRTSRARWRWAPPAGRSSGPRCCRSAQRLHRRRPCSASAARSARRSRVLSSCRIAQGRNFGWSLFDGGATFASKIARPTREFNNALPAGAYIAAGLVLFVLTFVVNSLARSIVAQEGGRTMTATTLDQPATPPAFQQVSAARKFKNSLATMLVLAVVPDRRRPAGVGAGHRDRQAASSVITAQLVDAVLQGVPARRVRRRRVPRDHRHACCRPGLRGHRGADRHAGRDLPRRVRPRAARQGHHVHGRHPLRCPVDRGRAVHLRAVDHHVRARPAARSPCRCPGAADDPGGRAVHRGDAADRPGRAARGLLRAGRARSGRRS